LGGAPAEADAPLNLRDSHPDGAVHKTVAVRSQW
jgi:hypothetical protein